MGNPNIIHHRKVLKILQRRLWKRELQAATYGISADPSIGIEMEDLKKEIRSLEWETAKILGNRTEARNRHVSDVSALENNISNVNFDLNGNWKLQETYDFGRTTADVRIHQSGSHLSGEMTIQDSMDGCEIAIIEERFSGTIREATVFLYGNYISTVGSMVDDYELDQWIGIIKDNNTIEGNSEDIDGTTGKFVMKRVS